MANEPPLEKCVVSIEKLAERAGLSYILVPGNPYIKEDLAKFAELIILECAKIPYWAIETGSYQHVQTCMAEVIVKLLKQQFGIK